MVDRVVRYKDNPPLMEAFGVDQEIKSTLQRRVDLPSGGYLIFDYAEAFTVIDVNTGRFVGGRGKNSGARLEDTITKNNLEAVTEGRFFFEGKPAMHSDHFVVLAEGKLVDLAPGAPVDEGAELTIELVEVDRHDAAAAVGKLDGLDVCVGDAADLVGKKVKVKVERVLDGTAYATLVRRAKQAPEPLTAEAEAEKPTRKPPARRTAAGVGAEIDAAEAAAEPAAGETPVADGAGPTPAKKKTRRGSRGGKNRKRPAGAAASTTAASTNGAEPQPDAEAEAEPAPEAEVEPERVPAAEIE